MTPLTTPRQLLAHELRTMLRVELTLAGEVLPELFELVHAIELKSNVDKHIVETERHVRNLRLVLAALEEPADPQPSGVLPALRQEHATLLRSIPADAHVLRDLAHAGALARTEHHEVAAYTMLVRLATALGVERDAVTLLRENLEQDAYALEQVERAVTKLLAESVEEPRGGGPVR